MNMKIAALLLLLVTHLALPQSDSNHIRSGAKVFIEKMDGFEDNFVAAQLLDVLVAQFAETSTRIV